MCCSPWIQEKQGQGIALPPTPVSQTRLVSQLRPTELPPPLTRLRTVVSKTRSASQKRPIGQPRGLSIHDFQAYVNWLLKASGLPVVYRRRVAPDVNCFYESVLALLEYTEIRMNTKGVSKYLNNFNQKTGICIIYTIIVLL